MAVRVYASPRNPSACLPAGTRASTGASPSASCSASRRCSSCRPCCSCGSSTARDRRLPGQPPDRFAQTLALDLGTGDRPRSELRRRTRTSTTRYGRDAHPFFVMMADGMDPFSNGGPISRAAAPRRARAAASRRRRSERRRPGSAAARAARARRADRGSAPGLASGSARCVAVAIVVDGQVAGVVVGPARAPVPVSAAALRAGALARRRRRARRRHRAGDGDYFRPGEKTAARRRGCRPPARWPAIDGPRALARAATKWPPSRQRSTRWPTISRRAPHALGDVGPRPPPAARRRLTRADDAGDGHARVSRNAHDVRVRARQGDGGRATSASSATRRRASSASSAISWISRASKAAAARSSSTPCRSGSSSTASSHGTSATCEEAGVRITAAIEPGARNGARRSRSARAGAAESRRQRAAIRAGGNGDRSARAPAQATSSRSR